MAAVQKLFMFYIGGDCGNSNIELHDVRFSIGATPEGCHDDLRHQWWGKPKSLHLDCWGEVAQVDGYDVVISTTAPSSDDPKLFFLNLGGYAPDMFAELHENTLTVAPDVQSAKKQALSKVTGWKQVHRDAGFEVEKAIDVSLMTSQPGLHLNLVKAAEEKPFAFTCKYLKLG
jgi:hypothetical protein